MLVFGNTWVDIETGRRFRVLPLQVQGAQKLRKHILEAPTRISELEHPVRERTPCPSFAFFNVALPPQLHSKSFGYECDFNCPVHLHNCPIESSSLGLLILNPEASFLKLP
jgi:hypothetical protein